MPLSIIRPAWLVIALLLLTGCATRAPHSTPTATAEPDTVLLISLDGTRPDYLQRGLTPHLTRLMHEGLQAQWLNPSYPSLTFPNHYTLVTGLRPDHHGIINNTMRDPVLGDFSLHNRSAVGDGRWWGGEPIWVSAEKAGLRTATMFWPGSEAAIRGIRPHQWHAFDKTIPLQTRIQQVQAWLALPVAERPRLITLYFEQIDVAGHEHGPDSEQVHDALRQVDTALGQLLDSMDAHQQSQHVNIIVVSDHGMAATSSERVMTIEKLIAPDQASTVGSGQVVGFNPLPGHSTDAERRLLGRHGPVECWRKHALPARWHYGTHARIPEIICQADEGWLLLPRAMVQKWRLSDTRGRPGGAHGYDPALPSMRAIFLARGPAFPRGQRMAAFDNVDVYPLLAHLLGIAPAPNDGNPDTLLPLLNPPSTQPATQQ